MHERRQYSPYGYKRVGASWVPLPGDVHGIMERLDDGQPRMNNRPACANCNIASHGFTCHFSDGSCLRSIQEGGGPDYGVSDSTAGNYDEAG